MKIGQERKEEKPIVNSRGRFRGIGGGGGGIIVNGTTEQTRGMAYKIDGNRGVFE